MFNRISNAYHKCKEKVVNATNAVVIGAGLSVASVTHAADGASFDAAAVGAQISSVIVGFVAMVSAVGMATITVVLTIQGFKMAWAMIKGVK